MQEERIGITAGGAWVYRIKKQILFKSSQSLIIAFGESH